MWWLFHSARGDLIHEIKALHDQYGDIVRIAPDQLSYVSPDAIKDIYERRAGQPENVKDPKMSSVRGSQDVRAINSATATKHAYLRKLLSPIFSIGAIKNFEPILLAEADRFIRNLEDTCAVDNGCIDLSFWFNMATFSQMGRVVFDESFEFMDTAALHWWIDSLPRFVKVLSMTRLLNNIPLLHYISPEIFMPASLKNGFQFHIQRTKTMVQKQKSVLVVGNSLMSLFLRGLDEKKLTEPEVIINAEFFVIAGSETTATHLSGTLYLLLANPATWQKLRDEVRSVFDSTDEINLTSVSKLKYMLAVQNESLRIYPPATDSPVRLTPPKGAMINGLFVPGNMKVGVNPYAAQRCSRNFSDTDCFIPERWTGEAKYSLDRREAFVPFSYGPRNCIGRKYVT
ncbi:Cytochrome p450 [Aspergillus sclerotialis]|uniref:Cytochrome p450 n=1 Tax=Aspergillus sclerotialis TaxID=2070753 RepID=A0A3A2ZPM9_9EURO|nr:Cytochrome p450 [Aspergillus sclerotialis]